METVIERVAQYQCDRICVTGGEPLAQKGCFPLLTALCDKGFAVSLETSGAVSIAAVDPRVMIVMDLKTPDSLESHRNDLSNLEYLKPQDQIKFVLCSRADYEWASGMIARYDLSSKAHLLFSPSWNQLNATDLANWIVVDKLPVRFQIQLHKILWKDQPGH